MNCGTYLIQIKISEFSVLLSLIFADCNHFIIQFCYFYIFRLMNIEEDTKKTVNNKVTPKITRRSLNKSEPKSNIKNNTNHKVDMNDVNSIIDDDGIYELLFTAVMQTKDDNNKPLYTHFQLLPSKKKYPEYYEVIEQPVDLKLVAQKIQGKKYTHLIEMERDLLLMCKNACLFNEPGSQIHKQAKTLKQVCL